MRSKNYDEETAAKKQNVRYTIIAVCCALAVLAAAVYTVRANPQWIARWDNRTLNINREGEQVDPGRVEGAGQSVAKPVPTVDSKDNTGGKAGEGAKPEKQGQSSGMLIMPAEGTISKKYSPEAPIYSKTLDQYTIHGGIDIDGEQDAPVKAAADGTVTKVFTDDKMGLTIQINHGNGFLTRYSNLSTDKLVGEGDVVKQGDVISGIGNTALFESIDPIHLHFEVWKDGKTVDPEKFLK